MTLEIDDLALSPSFNCYFSDSLTTTTAMAAAKVSREFILEQQQSSKFHEFIHVDEQDDFEFSQVFDTDNNKQQVFSGKQTATTVDFPVVELDTVNIQIRKLFVKNGVETSSFSNFSNSSSSSSTESEIESKDNEGPSGSFCMWRPKSEVVSHILTKRKESSSSAGAGSGRRWRKILDLLRRSNSEGSRWNIFFLRSNKNIKASSKQNRKVTPVEIAGKLKSAGGSPSPSFHEVFYARKRAEKELGEKKMKSFLPYRQDLHLLGFFVNINRIGSKK